VLLEIYVDILFLVNFGMNVLVFGAALVLCRKPVRLGRLAAGAGVSAGVYCILLFTPLARFLGIISALMILAIGLLICARYWSLRDFGLTLAMGYAAAFAASGAAVAIGGFLGGAMPHFMGGFSIWHLLFAAAISFAGLKFGQKYIMGRLVKKQEFRRCSILLNGKICQINGLIDSGNSLVEPISKEPVIIVEFAKIRHILPDAFADAFAKAPQSQIEAALSAGDFFQSRFCIIPFSSLGNPNGVILGFRPDGIEIENQGKPLQKTAIIGICDFALATDGGYHALINPTI